MQKPGRAMGLRQTLQPNRVPTIAYRPRTSCVRASAQTVPVTVSIKKQVSFGEVIRLVGNQSFLGNWEPGKAATLKWKDGHVWETTLDVPVGTDVCFKIIQVKEDGSSTWESGDDRKFKVLGPHYALQISCRWDDTNGTQIKAVPMKGAPEEDKDKNKDKDRDQQHREATSNGAKPHKSQDQGDAQRSFAASNGNGNGNGSRSGSSLPSSLSSLEEDARSTSAWVGAQPEFVRYKPEKFNREGVWRTDGLHGVEVDLVRGDQGANNWLGKLGLMKSLLVDRPHMMRPHVDELVACYVYGTWINTGAIRCVETGGHHRPNHHANAALQMFRSLEWSIGDAANGDGGMHWPAEARILAARRLHTRLPSISDEFRVSVPLTRIRDIAHRNDIPKDLKDEIKHTLQNKLHRSAGPEDLVATEAMLARVTAKPGQYSAAFVEEFKVFAVELREFFNASGLRELLDKTYPSLDDEHKAIVNQFRAAMSKLDSEANPSMQDLMSALLTGTQARCLYVRGLSAGLRNDVGDNVLSMRQRWRLAEIRIEDYVFVLLARIIGELEKAGGANLMAKSGVVMAWRAAVDALINGLRHLGLSGYATKELLMLENELQSWMNAYTKGDTYMRNETALRGKACVERIQRLASQYSDLVVSIYADPAKRLGDALGVPEHMSRIFAESEVRASVAFQVSRLVGLLNKTLRAVAEMDAWDGLVTGTTYGRLVEVEGISPEAMDKACAGHNDNVILLARRATGDEEVGSLGPRLAGVILCQELPHLSHLGVRARQEKCVFATCDDEEHVKSKVRPLLGKHLQMSVTTDGVTLVEGAAPKPAAKAPAPPSSSSSSASSSRQAAAQTRSPSPDPPRPSFSPRNRFKPSGASTPVRSPSPGAATVTTRVTSLGLMALSQATVETCGSKAAKCGELESLAGGAGSSLFSTPKGTVLPFGSMELVLQAGGKEREFQACLEVLEQPGLAGVALDGACDRMAALLHSLKLPPSLLAQITAKLGSGKLLAVRSSANVEDLAGMSAAGLYESKVGVPSDDSDALNAAIVEVWSSLYTRRAVLSRRAAGVGQLSACMSVLIMELMAPEVSFVLHTARPVDNNTNVILAELAPGQGETLASGTRGTPWRLEIEKSTNKVETLAFANFSRALVVPGMPSVPGFGSPTASLKAIKYNSFDEQYGGSGGGGGGTGVATRTGLVEVEVDYSQQRLSTDNAYREQVARHLARVGMLIESTYNKQPQDIEGGLVSAGPGSDQLRVMVFQTRPQH